MNTNQSQPQRKFPRSLAIILMVAGALLALAIAGTALFIFQPDGTERLTGVRLDIAKKAKNFEQKNSSISPLPSFVRQIHVDEVRPISADEKDKYCDDPAYVSDDPNDPRYYVVTLSLHVLFEFKTESVTEYGCSLLRFDEGYLR